jgi:hypothetical protein
LIEGHFDSLLLVGHAHSHHSVGQWSRARPRSEPSAYPLLIR